MNEIEKLIWNKGEIISQYSTKQWVAIVEHLLDSLEAYLNAPVYCVDTIEENVGNGFCVDVRSKDDPKLPLHIQFQGILGGAVAGDPQYLYVSFTLFLFSGNKKLITKENDSFIEFAYLQL